MNNLINRSYNSIVARGLIKQNTLIIEFIKKVQEESNEVIIEFCKCDIFYDNRKRLSEELIDLANVCLNCVKHMGFDPEKEFTKCIELQEQRAKKKCQDQVK